MFDSWAMATPPGPRQRPPVKLRLEALENRVVPALWYVDTLGDSGLGMINPQGGGGQGDLRFCMINAASGDTIDFGVSGTIKLDLPLPSIIGNITIDGAGQNVEIWGGGNVGIFNISAGATAEIDNLSIDSGFDNTVGAVGGGAYNDGDLTLKNDTFLGNKATYGGAIYNDSGATLKMSGVSLNNNSATDSGGGIYNLGDLTCEGHCSIVSNKAANGAGVENQGSALFEQEAEISGNQATGLGGGIRVDAGNVTVTGNFGSAAIDYNTASAGGGIYNAGGTLTLTLTSRLTTTRPPQGMAGVSWRAEEL